VAGIVCVVFAIDILKLIEEKWQLSLFDYHNIFVVHGVAGWVGMLLTAGFARYVIRFFLSLIQSKLNNSVPKSQRWTVTL
jgi:ammonia channel protein AmtB